MSGKDESSERDESPRPTDEALRNNPGRTPGKAEGEERDVEQALRNEGSEESKNS